MSGSLHSRQSNFDNPNYFSDGRDRTGYTNRPRISSDAAITDHGLILQPNRLKHFAKDANTVYSYRPGQDNIYAYSNAAFRFVFRLKENHLKYAVSFSDISRPSYRSSSPNFYSPNKPFHRPSATRQGKFINLFFISHINNNSIELSSESLLEILVYFRTCGVGNSHCNRYNDWHCFDSFEKSRSVVKTRFRLIYLSGFAQNFSVRYRVIQVKKSFKSMRHIANVNVSE